MIKSITLLLIFFFFNLHASTSVNGTFKATQSCPAYLSKNGKVNPDNLMVILNQHYVIKEINKIPPDWLRIEFPGRENALQWVNASCGVAEYSGHNPTACDSKAGLADAYVLALSSQPGFCQTYGYEAGKPECLKLSKTSYQANHLTLHGLWPNQLACGQHYGFCGVKPKPGHCDYNPVQLGVDVAEKLKKIMPSYYYSSCLERHEWNKHGSCQILNEDEYFSLAMRLAIEMDHTLFGQYLTEHKGETVKLVTLKKLISESLGAENVNKVAFGCKNGILVDVLVQLPALIPFDESLVSLINKASDRKMRDLCSSLVTISNFNKLSWF